VVATELVVAFRALRMRGPIPVEGEVGELLAAASERLAPELGDRALGDDVEAARRLMVEERGTASARAPGRQPLGKR
jgi:histidine ammonia-lyase